MKYADLLFALSISGSIIAACSASGTSPTGSNGTGAAGAASPAGASGPGGSGAGSSTGPGNSGSSSGNGGSATGSGGGATGSGGGPASSSSGGGMGPIDFDGGWQVPDSGMQPPLVGDGGTEVTIGPGADASSPGKFGGADNPNAKPSVVYPPDGVVVPPNMNSIEFHFIPGAGQTLFEFSFHTPSASLVVYVGCTPLNGGCVYKPDASFWSNFVPFGRGAQPVTYKVRGVNGGSPGAVGSSAQRTIAFADQDMSGGIYYWNTAGVVQRYDFGYPNAPVQQYLTPQNFGAFFCVGCHVVSRDGKEIVAGADIPSPAPYKLFDVASKQPVQVNGMPVSGGANFFSFSPDEKHLLTSDGVSIAWRSLVTGNVVNPAVVNPGTMPDWSPDGLHMVYAKPQQGPPFGFAVPGVDSASLMTLHFNGVGWDSPTTLVPFGGQNNYYPAYAPTGDWVIFNRSPGNANSFSNAGPDADAGTVPDGELWAVSSAGGAPVRLDKATNPGACSWPKWAPVLHDYYGGKILWLTFSSARAYGLRLADGQQTQLWMVGFDPGKAALGQDPSLPAFWLPFQDINGGNHIAQWATKVPRKPCQMDAQCDQGEICKNGHCAPN